MKQWVIKFGLALVFAGTAMAAEVAGVGFDDEARVAGATLHLNGAGLRTRAALFKVYALGLYLPQKADTAEAVLAQTGPKRLHLVTLRDLTAEQFADALVQGLEKNHSEEELAGLRERMTAFRALMLKLGAANKGTVVQLDYLPASGTRLTVNGAVQGEEIPSEDFYRALLRIWLGDRPAQEDLKEALLGRAA